MNEGVEKYVSMQKAFYDNIVAKGGFEGAMQVVGPAQHASHATTFWKRLLIQDRHYARGLDFGCGVGRLMAGFHEQFDFIDGVDISVEMLKWAEVYLRKHKVPQDKYKLHVCNGYDLADFESDIYDIVYSQITMHHICVWEIRNNYFKEFYRVLKPKGCIAIQMHGGFNFAPPVRAAKWYENYYDAEATNSYYDVKLDNPLVVAKDLFKIGYTHVSFDVLQEHNPDKTGNAIHEYTIVIKAMK